MNLINPDKLQLVPGQSIQGIFAPSPNKPEQIGFFVRSATGVIRQNGGLNIRQRAGLIQYNNVLLVVTMIKVEGHIEELFDIWWNYHSQDGAEHFRRIAEQDTLIVHFYDENGKGFQVHTENRFRKFFKYVPSVLQKSKPWTEIEFDRAVRGFCARAYPKENLWEMIELQNIAREPKTSATPGIENYRGTIPEELKKFYVYLPEQGHCIKIIPSMLEQDSISGNPEEFLYPAPVKTVLRCGIRWVKGYPVAPIPFIPGHGLAVPPDDTEF